MLFHRQGARPGCQLLTENIGNCQLSWWAALQWKNSIIGGWSVSELIFFFHQQQEQNIFLGIMYLQLLFWHTAQKFQIIQHWKYRIPHRVGEAGHAMSQVSKKYRYSWNPISFLWGGVFWVGSVVGLILTEKLWCLFFLGILCLNTRQQDYKKYFSV